MDLPIRPERDALWSSLQRAPLLLFSMDLDGRITSLGGGAVDPRRAPPESIVGTRVFDRGLPEIAKDAVRRALAGESLGVVAAINSRQWDIRLSPVVVEGAVRGAFGIAIDVTERHAAQQRALESEARLRALVDALPIDIWALDADGRCVLQNPSTIRHYGPLVGLEPREATELHPDVREAWSRRLGLDGEGSIRHWEKLPSELGERVVDTVIAPILVDGRCVGSVGANLDLTEHVRAQAELERQRDFIDAVVETAATLLVVLDADARIVRFNRASEALTGLSRASVEGRPFWEALVGEADAERVRRAFADTQGRGFPRQFEIRLRTSGETSPLVAWTNEPLFREGRLEHVICSGVDVTHRREEEASRARRLVEAQEARRRSEFLAEAGRALAGSLDYEETLTTVAELAVKAFADLCVVDLLGEDGQPRRVAVACGDPEKRPLAEQLKRFTPDPHAPKGIPHVLRTGEPYLSSRVAEDVRSGGESARSRVGIRNEDHQRVLRELPMRSMLSVPLTTPRRNLGAMTFISTDPLRAYAESDVDFAMGLASRAALAVENARLYREAREAVRAREEFLSIASHELRTPLTSLQLCAQSLPRMPVEAPSEAEARYQKQALETIERQSRRLARLVDTLLDVTRAQAGQLQLVTEETDLAALAREVAAQFAQELEAVGQALHVDAPESLVGEWDRPRFDQVLTNLVSNAIKYGESRPISVIVAAREGEAVVEVRDRGIGIAPERHAAVFERFERGAQKRVSGLGLGLYIAKCIVDAHGGRIGLESAPGQGTCVRVVLPLRR